VKLSTIKKKFRLGKYTEEERPLLSRLALHAFMLNFKGMDGKDYSIEAPLPKDMSALLTQLRKHRGKQPVSE
jgi:23S rRNA pseudouridine955/2504/2580 synthase/23S rRNA pseudouridine1911/1915/1917 synthase